MSISSLYKFKWYLDQEIVEINDERFSFPTGMLGDIEIRFNHYKTFEEAVNKWNERKRELIGITYSSWGLMEMDVLMSL